MEMTPDFFDRYKERMSNQTSVEAQHVRVMMDKIPTFFPDHKEKAMRWIGFVQGWFWANGLFTIDEMKEHNR